MLKMYDILRIDHFRGFESFYAIPYGDKDATGGHWKKGPDIKFFKEISADLGDNLPIIAEDLGFLTKDVEAMLKFTGYPGMKVLQFGFEGNYNNVYLPHNYIKNSVVYLGTHDNDTILGWAKTTREENLEFAKKYLDIKKNDNINTKFINSALSSVADTVILTMADILGLDSKARINIPSTIGTNWKWRIKEGVLTEKLAADIYNITRLYCR
jgi:4-alpha-glucanotransferase